MNSLRGEFESSMTHKRIYTDNQYFTKPKSVPKCLPQTIDVILVEQYFLATDL